MSRFRLRTLGEVALSGPSGTVPLDEPRLVAFLVMLTLTADEGVSDDELLLRLTPEATPVEGRAELARLASALRTKLGDDAAVVRTAGGYTLAAGTVSTDVRLLSGPAAAACAAFLPSFRLTGSPEFGEWLEEMRLRLEPRPDPAVMWWKRGSTRAAAVFVLVVVALTAAYRLMPRAVDGFSVGDPLLLADVRNETGDPELDEGLRTAATITLQQSGRIRLYPRGRLPVVYSLMQIDNRDTALSFELAREVAERDHVRFVLGLQVDRLGEGFRVAALLADVTDGSVEESFANAASRDEVLDALDEVLLAVRRRLGESRSELAEHRLPLPQVTTASLAALRSYAEGSSAWERGDYRLAGESWLRAVDLDTGFAMAYGALGGWHYYHHSRADGARYYAEALRRAHRLTEREHLRLLEADAGYRGLIDSSLTLSGVIASRYPSVLTWYNHGTGLMAARRYEDAIAALTTALTFDSSNVNSHLNLATASNGLDRPDDALMHYAEAGRLDSMALYRNNINHEWGGTLVSVGRLAEAESAFRSMAGRSNIGDRALGLRSLGYLALWRGRVDESIALFESASSAARQSNADLSEARNRLLLAGSYRLAGREREANREVDRAIASMASPSFEPVFLAMIATNCVRLGRVADLEVVLNVLRTRMAPESGLDSAAEAYVSGLLLLSRNRPSDALAAASRAEMLPLRVSRLMLEAEAFVALGQLDSARKRLELVHDERGFGRDSEEDWLRSHLLLGNLQLAQGDTVAALQSFRRLAEQWREAPAALPDLVSARSQLAALTASRR